MKAKPAGPDVSTRTLYISYAHEDREWRDKIVKYLAPLQQNGTIRIWDDQSIRLGNHWQEEIQQALDESRVAVVLVSAASLSSKFISDVEIRRLLQKREMGDFKIIPVLLSPCAWQEVPWLAGTQILPRTGSPLEELSVKDQNSALSELSQELQRDSRRLPPIAESKRVESLPSSPKKGATLGAVFGGVVSAPMLNLSPETERLLIKIKRQLVNSKQSGKGRITGVFGPPGSGKTVLTHLIARDDDVRRQFLDGVFYLPSRSSGSLTQDARKLFTDAFPESGSHPDGELLAFLSQRRVLLIIDEVHERLDDAIAIRSLAEHVSVLVVTRDRVLLDRLDAYIHEIRFPLIVKTEDSQSRSSGGSETHRQPPSEADRKRLSREITVGELLGKTDLGRSMADEDRKAFWAGAALALSQSRSELGSSHVFAGYLLTAKPGNGKSEQALAAAAWAAYLVTHPDQTKGDGKDEMWRIFSHQDVRPLIEKAMTFPGLGDSLQVSAGLRRMLLRSYEVAAEAGRPQDFSTRHLLLCLLGPREWRHDPDGTAEIAGMNLDLEAIRGSFRAWIAKRRSRDNPLVIADLLGLPNEPISSEENNKPPAPASVTRTTSDDFTSGPAGYSSEFCGVGGSGPVADQLGVEPMAHRLADLIALRETKLPLAIGLFGNWGSGKSHFMNLMDRRLKALTEEEKLQSVGTPSRWCREIVPIYFNAWHYLDSNLWASLVSQIFDGLFRHLRPKANDLEKVQKLLEMAEGATARAAEEVTFAHNETEKAKEALRVAQETRRHQETVVDGLLYGLKNLLPEVTPADLQQQVIELLGVEKSVDTLVDLRDVLKEAHSIGGRARSVWKAAWKRPGRWWRIAFLVSAVLVVPWLSIAAASYLPFFKQQMQGIGRVIVGFLTGLPALLVWIRPILAEAKRHLKKMEDWEKRAEAAQSAARETAAVKEAKLNVDLAAAKEDSARLQLTEADAREKQLRAEARTLAPERRLGRFIEERAQSSDYRDQLGLVSLARRDFQEMSDLFADTNALKERVSKMRATKAQKDKEEAKQLEEEAEQLEELSKSVDRIVLFVDDLDRCQPEKVVDVLQAVHLLLAFPLFAVVVGVDQRCLRQSLRMQFKGLLTSDEEPMESGNKNAKKRNESTANTERPATPLDYLEKIFHVPFHLPDMGKEGFSKLMHNLTESYDPKDPASAKGTHPPENEQLSPLTEDQEVADNQNDQLPDDRRKLEASDAPIVEDLPTTPLIEAHRPDSNTTTRVFGSVPLLPWEREALKDYHPLIRTPRGATRLLNTYRLVRAGIPADEWDTFRGDGVVNGEFRIVLLLLAAAAGYPAVAREWFRVLRTANSSALFMSTDPKGIDPVAWKQFKNVYDATFESTMPKPTRDLFGKWLDLVERFAF